MDIGDQAGLMDTDHGDRAGSMDMDQRGSMDTEWASSMVTGHLS